MVLSDKMPFKIEHTATATGISSNKIFAMGLLIEETETFFLKLSNPQVCKLTGQNCPGYIRPCNICFLTRIYFDQKLTKY